MRKLYYHIAAIFAATCLITACADSNDVTAGGDNGGTTELKIPEDAKKGELLIKFNPDVTEMLDKMQTRSGGKASTRSSIPSVDRVLQLLGTYHFERVFPVNNKTEERARKAGLNLWYIARFDANKDLMEAARDLGDLGEVNTVQFNREIKRAYNPGTRPVIVSRAALRTSRAATGDLPFNDKGLSDQWGYINNAQTITTHDADGNETGTLKPMIAGADVNCKEAWKKCTGDPSIIVAVLDEGVMYTHEDLKANIWKNPGENDVTSLKDNDGNGYIGDVHGYNFVTKSGAITWAQSTDTGHGTHVAGTIAAVNNNGTGVCGIAGGDGTPDSGVKIMSCQVFDGDKGVDLNGEAQAIKYAADNGAVVLQCSWGYNSGSSNEIEGYTPGPKTEKEWTTDYPLEKDALDYFVHNAGSPNGVIEGGIVVYAAGNEYAPAAGFPGAGSDYLSVAAMSADFTPSAYSNYGDAVDLIAPGGDSEYHCATEGDILSTIPNNLNPDKFSGDYGYMEGTSMACPHVSGVVALGLSYAAKLHKHFTADEFKQILLTSAKEVESKWTSPVKTYYHNWAGTGMSHPIQMNLSDYKGKVGKLVDAGALLNAIDGAGTPMKLPNVYVAIEKTASIDLSRYFDNGASLTYTIEVADASIASATTEKSVLTVKGLKTGVTKATVKVSNGTTQEIYITVRKTTGEGWM